MPVFFVDGHQIGDDEGAVELFLAAVQLLGVLDEGHRAGNALIAAAGVDDDRQLAAVHAGIGACGGLGFCAVGDIVAVSGQQHPPDVGTVVAQQALFCNGVVVADLPFQQVCHVPQVGGLGKVPDVLHVQQAAVGAGILLHGLVQQGAPRTAPCRSSRCGRCWCGSPRCALGRSPARSAR